MASTDKTTRTGWRTQCQRALYSLFPGIDYEVRFDTIQPHLPHAYPNQFSGRIFSLCSEKPQAFRFIAVGQDGDNALIFTKHYEWLTKNTPLSHRKDSVILWLKKDGTNYVASADDEALHKLYGSGRARGMINGEEYMILRPTVFCQVKEGFFEQRLLKKPKKKDPVQLDMLSDPNELHGYQEKFQTWAALCGRYNVPNVYARTKSPNSKTILTVMQLIGGTHKFSGLLSISPNRHQDGYIAIHQSKPKE